MIFYVLHIISYILYIIYYILYVYHIHEIYQYIYHVHKPQFVFGVMKQLSPQSGSAACNWARS